MSLVAVQIQGGGEFQTRIAELRSSSGETDGLGAARLDGPWQPALRRHCHGRLTHPPDGYALQVVGGLEVAQQAVDLRALERSQRELPDAPVDADALRVFTVLEILIRQVTSVLR